MPQTYSTRPLRRIRGDNPWCGPAVVSAVTGHSTDDAARLIREFTGRPATGTQTAELRHALEQLGYSMKCTYWYMRRPLEERPTLREWIANRKSPRLTFIVGITGHWVAIRSRKFIDNSTRTPIPLDEAPHQGARVWTAYVIRPAQEVRE